MNLRPVLLVLALLVPAMGTAAVYKWVDAQGRVHYADKPPGTAAEEVDIESRRTNPEEVQARLAAAAAAAEARARAATEAAAGETETAEQRERREENCSRARRNLESLLSATRVYDPLPGGERRYLEQEEVDERVARARTDVENWCNGTS